MTNVTWERWILQMDFLGSGTVRGTYPVDALEARLDVSGFVPGLYLLRIVFADGYSCVAKWVKGG